MLKKNKKGRPKNNFIAWDVRGDYIGSAKTLRRTKGIWLTRSKWNSLKPPPMPDNEYKQNNINRWFDAVAGKIADFLELGIAGKNYLARHLKELYRSEFQQANRWPAMKDLIIYFDNLSCDSRDEKGYRDRVKEKLIAFDSACEYMLDCEAGYDFAKLVDEGWNLIFYVADLDKIFCDLTTVMLMEYFYYYRMWNDEKPRSRLFMVLDEQRHLLQKQPSKLFNITDFNLLLVRCRKFDIAFIFVEQVSTQISDAVTSQARIKLAFNTQAKEVGSIQEIMGLKYDQAAASRELSRGQCIITLGSSRWPYPMVMDTEKYHTKITDLSQAQITRICERSTADMESDVQPRFLRYEESVTASKDAEKDPDALTKNECLILGFLAHGPNTINRICEKTGLDTQQENIGRSALSKKGHLQSHGTFGNKRKVISLTGKGEAKAEELGYTVHKYKSDAIHEVILTETQLGLGVAIPGSKFQRKNIAFNNVQLDSLMSFPGKSGIRAGIQIVASHTNYAREAINIKKLSEVKDLDFIIVISANRKIQTGLDKYLNKEFGGEIDSKVKTFNAEQIFQPDWNWKAQFGL